MPKIKYVGKKFGDAAWDVIDQANSILVEYAAMGYDLTLRQLYYQFVARDIIPNKQSEYNRLGNIVNDARLAGLIDWNNIVDRTRNLETLPNWNSPAAVIKQVAKQFLIDKWADQPYRIEVWIEKDALLGVIENVCDNLQVPYFSCRGYTSQSEMWSAGQRIVKYLDAGQDVRILHLGDHDPSGIDMTRDIRERLSLFAGSHAYWGDIAGTPEFEGGRAPIDYVLSRFWVDRLALNMDQVEQYDPPPNPAKLSDSRARNYIREYGDESWELDALPPDVLGNLIEDGVAGYRDEEKWDDAVAEEEEHIATLQAVSDKWSAVKEFVNGNA